MVEQISKVKTGMLRLYARPLAKPRIALEIIYCQRNLQQLDAPYFLFFFHYPLVLVSVSLLFEVGINLFIITFYRGSKVWNDVEFHLQTNCISIFLHIQPKPISQI